MGSWEYGPFDNDDASDFWYEIRRAKNPMKALEKHLKNDNCGHELQRRAAAAFVQFLLKFDRRSLQRQKKMALEALRELRNNESFISDWKDSRAIKRRLNKEIKDLSE